MTNPGEIPMTDAVLEVEPAARARHIEALTGVQPDPKHFMPIEKMKEVVAGVQAQSPLAAQELIAKKITLLYKYIQATPEITERHDLSLGDAMQMSCQAITEAATKLEASSPYISSELTRDSVRELGKLLTASRLVAPTSEESSRVLIGVANGNEDRIIDPVEWVEGEDELSELITSSSDVERTVIIKDTREKLLRYYISDRAQYALARYFGLFDMPTLRLEDIGEEFGMTREGARQIIEKALKQIHITHGRPDILYEDASPEEFYETWLPDA